MALQAAAANPTHPRHLEVPENTALLAAENTPVVDLRGPCVGVHLGELELGDGARAGGQRRVADDVAEGLPVAGEGSQ